jgi:hypothetical protein
VITLLVLASLAAPTEWLCPNDDDGGLLLSFPSLKTSHLDIGAYIVAYGKAEFAGLLCTAILCVPRGDLYVADPRRHRNGAGPFRSSRSSRLTFIWRECSRSTTRCTFSDSSRQKT